ncbi:uncharacterized protein CANTADRAFT_45198 [Suhomyces tanzawaensis NRRL Y-17324]|uniref:Ras modification protein ERF4 n=1 Tax=Suhomyces tanzawaensis NRRL Y-17324 TaxID=984487 RepID=A0A1E4SQ11_9ASCO|nr:uncharacterized protein CANTADRAFT_45198 [Suhomyces tanzawaensis NRRL Y-17324]ODV81604.1 hypothetical protein CANTADRAFT_45198 [Suhomyces tanzawaensis NRRL Y-17324]
MTANINDPNTKYAHKPEPQETPTKDKLLFFNYHEFLTSDYKSNQSITTDTSLVVNHFPNNYEAKESLQHSSTRIVRIPRVYDTNRYSDVIPQFSVHVPGKEPAALTGSSSEADQGYEVSGVFDDNWFGLTSLTPLVPGWLSVEEFTAIVTRINQLLYDALNPFDYRNAFQSVLDVMSGGTLSLLVNPYSKKKLLELESYIDTDVNVKLAEKCKGLKVIPLRQSGYLSLDFQVPRPHQ